MDNLLDAIMAEGLAGLRSTAELTRQIGAAVASERDEVTETPPQMPLPVAPGAEFYFTLTLDGLAVTDDVAAAYFTINHNGYTWEVTGSSKRDPQDKVDQEVGALLAIGRALEKVASQVNRQAQGRIKNNDNIRAQRKARLAEKVNEAKKSKRAKKARPVLKALSRG